MIDYELAKELKEAGFPKFGFDVDTTGTVMPNVLNAPTLSELIEACGEKFKNLRSVNNGYQADSNVWVDGEQDEGGFISSFGKTPEEAVARLWLALNKK